MKSGKILLASLIAISIHASAYAQTTTFSYTGSYAQYVVPTNVTSISFDLLGASGGGASGGGWTVYGGLGSELKGNLSVSSGEILYIFVGGAGIDGSLNNPLGGFNGGGNGSNNSGGGGGGATDIRLGGLSLTNRIAIAAGGGGANTVGGYGGEGGDSTNSIFNAILGIGSDGLGGGGGGGYYGGEGAVYGYHGNASGGESWAELNIVSGTTISHGGNGVSSTSANGMVTITAVPESSTYALFGLGALVLIVNYCRKIV